MKWNILFVVAIVVATLAAILPILSHNRLQTLESEVGGLQKRNGELERQLQDADHEVEAARVAAEERNAAVVAENRSLRQGNLELEEKLKTTTADLAKLRSLDAGMKDIDRQHAELRGKVDALRNEMQTTRLKTGR